ncbi:hypothetical protein OR62_07310 [Clostridium tetani]|uniref:Class I SAM-dependent methyltransferase n=1 Tax=Clostridium tetani TaxID=1513 RepID=A0ABY0EL90_CLOTA|nr:class I SAM-dependent methyltransferase [Clostridium tetani]KHO39284.1 hypothetical protein OR62_07310 [Clostridium tetani]RXI51635.1 class I SAM-dependent methyltransferase [Clostridium tetani]RXI74140.1 class I SAM-dependent methyltransferase [Clostridium tetani]
MNKSTFIQHTKENYGLDFEKLWQEGILAKSEYDVQRAMDFYVEKNFWKDFAPKYDNKPTLYDYAPEAFDKLLEITGRDKIIAEIGPGTGKFTLPMSNHSKKILAIDASEYMLEILNKKISKNNILNVKSICSKWEDASIGKVDTIFNVNAIYRMWNIKDSLIKMNNLAKEKVVIVWTLQRSPFHNIFCKLGQPGLKTKSDYIYIQNILYELGIDSNIEFLDIIKPIQYNNKEDLYKSFTKEYGKSLPIDNIKKLLDCQVITYKDYIIFNAKLKVAFIHWNTLK